MDSNFKSKKFAAFLLSEVSWKALAILTLFWGRDNISTQVFWVLLAIIATAGFIEVAYIAGQSGLDKYLKGLEILTTAGHKVKIVPPSGTIIEASKSGDTEGKA